MWLWVVVFFGGRVGVSRFDCGGFFCILGRVWRKVLVGMEGRFIVGFRCGVRSFLFCRIGRSIGGLSLRGV